jgi:hypothetical protein
MGVVIIVYVDDILLFGKDKHLVASAKQQLCNTYEMRDIRDLDTYHGMEIQHDRAKGVLSRIHLQDTRHIRFRRWGLHKTPMDSRAACTPNAHGQADEMMVKDDQSMIGSLLYLAIYSI